MASASAVAALLWSLQHGQLQQLDEGARVIFDQEEQQDQETPLDVAPRRDQARASRFVDFNETDQFPPA